jgi:uncharacterized membrane protein
MSFDTHADDPQATEPLHVGVARFSGVEGAERAFAEARDRDPAAAWIGDAAFVEVHRNGRIVVRGSVAGHYVDIDGLGDAMGRDTGRGAVVGAAVGFLLGPPAFAVGVVGGASVGGVVETSHIPKPDGPAFDAIREQVPRGTSALVVVSDAASAQAMTEAVAGEAVEHHRLSPAADSELRRALAQAPPADPTSSR